MSIGDQELVEKKTAIEDPREFFRAFRESADYQRAYQGRLGKIKPQPTVTEEQIRAAMEESDEMKFAFLDFAKNHPFHYEPRYFSKETRKTIKQYLDSIREMIKVSRELSGTTEENQKALFGYDHSRRLAHEEAARALCAEEITSSLRLGKGLASLVAIEKGLDTLGGVRERDATRIQRMLLDF